MEGRVSTNPGRRWPVDLPLGSQLHPRATSPCWGCDAQQPANRAYCRAPSSTRQSGSSLDKGLRSAPAPPSRGGDRSHGPWWRLNRPFSVKAGGALARREAVPMPPASCLPHPAWPPPPGPVPGFSPASVEVAEESLRKLGSLCERPRDTRQPLPSSDAAMGKAARGQVGGRHRIRAS